MTARHARNLPATEDGRGNDDVPISWPGDPHLDAEMNAQSLADLAAKQRPIDWIPIDIAVEDEDRRYQIAGAAPWLPTIDTTDQSVRLDSPLEEAFWAAYDETKPHALHGLVTQHEVQTPEGTYRIDFALPQHKIGFEVDGYTYHSSRAAWTRDRRRDVALTIAGWRIHRFDGDQVRKNPHKVIERAAHLAAAYAVEVQA